MQTSHKILQQAQPQKRVERCQLHVSEHTKITFQSGLKLKQDYSVSNKLKFFLQKKTDLCSMIQSQKVIHNLLQI